MNIDKQLIDAINEWLLNLTDGYFQLSKYSMGDDDTTWKAFEEIKKVTLEANKQSILKAIMEKVKRRTAELEIQLEGTEDMDFFRQNTARVLELRIFESVIKEVLK